MYTRLFILFLLIYCSVIFAEDRPELTPVKTKQSFGRLKILSTPSNAKIILNGKETTYTTPALLTKIEPGLNTVELTLPDYLFAKRQIQVVEDSTITISFELISLSDTAHIIGDLKLGILVLPQPPLNTPYFVDNKQVYSREVTLNAGKHHVVWEGGNRYTSLDTIVEIFPGKLTTFQFFPLRLFGDLTITPTPSDADIYLNNRLYSTGTLNLTIATGTYTISARRSGYYDKEKQITVIPQKGSEVFLDLIEIPDKDQDGFLDSLDNCPETYGLYAGCPKEDRREAIKKYRAVLANNFKQQDLVFSINTIGYLYRTPTNQIFREFLSYFNDGPILLNNKNGFTLANTFTASFRGVFLSCELGQWITGLHYKKKNYNPLIISTGKDSTQQDYCLYYDTTAGIAPRISLPSTAISLGFIFAVKRLNIAYSIGHQWENIKIFDLIKKEDFNRHYQLTPFAEYSGPRTNITYSNNCWFNRLYAELDIIKLKHTQPCLYGSMAISFNPKAYTGWHTIQAGIRYKFYPRPKGKNKK